ncbi:MAG: MFS transporter [Thermoproteota archaeon]
MILSEAFRTLTYPQWFSIYLKKDLGAGDEEIGFVNAVQSGASLLLQPLGGAVGQKFNKKRLYLLGLVIQALAFLIAFLAEDWTWTILMSLILGCSALVGPGVLALIGEITDRATRATAFALKATIISLTVMLQGPLQGFIAQTVGLRPLYLLAIIGLTVSFLIFLLFFRDVERERSTEKGDVPTGRESSKNWKRQVRQVFAKPDYRRNFIGLIGTGVAWRLFVNGFSPFITIYLYEEIGWSFLFFGFYGFAGSLLALVLQIPFGKLMDKYHLKRIFFFIGPLIDGIRLLLLVFVRDPYLLAAIFLFESATGIGHVLAVTALWYDAIPIEVYSIGSAISGVIYGCTEVVGFLLDAYLWASLGPVSFYIMSTGRLLSSFVALHLIRDIKNEK